MPTSFPAWETRAIGSSEQNNSLNTFSPGAVAGAFFVIGYILPGKGKESAMPENKTKPTEQAPEELMEGLTGGEKEDALALMRLMAEVTGEAPVMWGGSIVGFGKYRYRYASGHAGESARVGFSPRKQALTLYLGYSLEGLDHELEALGKHKRGKGCLYISRLSDIDESALRRLVKKTYEETRDFDFREALK